MGSRSIGVQGEKGLAGMVAMGGGERGSPSNLSFARLPKDFVADNSMSDMLKESKLSTGFSKSMVDGIGECGCPSLLVPSYLAFLLSARFCFPAPLLACSCLAVKALFARGDTLFVAPLGVGEEEEEEGDERPIGCCGEGPRWVELDWQMMVNVLVLTALSVFLEADLGGGGAGLAGFRCEGEVCEDPLGSGEGVLLGDLAVSVSNVVREGVLAPSETPLDCSTAASPDCLLIPTFPDWSCCTCSPACGALWPSWPD